MGLRKVSSIFDPDPIIDIAKTPSPRVHIDELKRKDKAKKDQHDDP